MSDIFTATNSVLLRAPVFFSLAPGHGRAAAFVTALSLSLFLRCPFLTSARALPAFSRVCARLPREPVGFSQDLCCSALKPNERTSGDVISCSPLARPADSRSLRYPSPLCYVCRFVGYPRRGLSTKLLSFSMLLPTVSVRFRIRVGQTIANTRKGTRATFTKP